LLSCRAHRAYSKALLVELPKIGEGAVHSKRMVHLKLNTVKKTQHIISTHRLSSSKSKEMNYRDAEATSLPTTISQSQRQLMAL
jgi:hypothetical protein